MAFLEAQAWSRAMDGYTAHGASATTIDGHGLDDRKERTRVQRASYAWLAMAACVLVSFVVGAAAQHVFSQFQSRTVATVVEADGAGNALPTDGARAGEDGLVPQGDRPGTLAHAIPDRSSAGPAEMFGGSPSPAQLLEALERSGHQIHRQQGIVPFSFRDGRQGFVPVEDLYVVPTQLTTY
jgi:hypothetical protein